MDISSSSITSTLALVLSIYATYKTVKFNARQESLIESQKRLNAILFEKEANEALDNKKADVSATISPNGTRNKKLVVYNQGKCTARNVAISFPEGNDFLLPTEVQQKFPLEILERFASVELYVLDEFGIKPKQAIILKWDDDFQSGREKTVHLIL